MLELDDSDLLKEYVDHGSEEAFAALVARHVNKVYSIALRHTRNAHQAEEITQAVFVLLARKSRQLGKRVILSGWLCRTAQLSAVTFVRSEIRRTRREQEAHMQNLLNESEAEVWPQIAPLLDAAMAGLSEADYDAVALRFFDGKSMKEIGAALGASEDAVKMRVNRAVEIVLDTFSRYRQPAKLLLVQALGLGSVYIGLVFDNMARIRQMCKLPKGVVPVVSLAVGYPKVKPPRRKRLPATLLAHNEVYRDPADKELLAAFHKRYEGVTQELTGKDLKIFTGSCKTAQNTKKGRTMSAASASWTCCNVKTPCSRPGC